MRFRHLFVDMTSYFASAEHQRRPALRGKPVAVIPVAAETTSCIAASYEAKAFGVKTGTPVYEARRACPGIHILVADPKYYVILHRRIVAAIESCLHVDEIVSIDEVCCRLMGDEELAENAIALARRVKQAIYEQAGEAMRCSIGLSMNKFLAKVACDMQKPDGLVTIGLEDLPGKLHSLELRDFPGVGHNMHLRLNQFGIRTAEQLCSASAADLRAVWGGVMGEWIWNWLRGNDLKTAATHRKTVGHSYVLPPAERTSQRAHAVFIRLISKVASRLRAIQYWAGTMTVGISYEDHSHWHADAPLGCCQDTLTMIEAFESLWQRRPDRQPKKLSVTLIHLTSNEYAAPPLFVEEQHRVKLAAAMDRVNDKFGQHRIYFGGMHGAQQAAPPRIAFTRIPDETDFGETLLTAGKEELV